MASNRDLVFSLYCQCTSKQAHSLERGRKRSAKPGRKRSAPGLADQQSISQWIRVQYFTSECNNQGLLSEVSHSETVGYALLSGLSAE